MFKINEKAFPRLSRDDKGQIQIAAYKMFDTFHSENGLGMAINGDEGFTLYHLDGYGNPMLSARSETFYYAEFEKKYINDQWEYVKVKK